MKTLTIFLFLLPICVFSQKLDHFSHRIHQHAPSVFVQSQKIHIRTSDNCEHTQLLDVTGKQIDTPTERRDAQYRIVNTGQIPSGIYILCVNHRYFRKVHIDHP